MKVRKTNKQRCTNCRTSRYGIKTRGLCSRCYPIVLRLEHTQRWNPLEPTTLLHYPRSPVGIALPDASERMNYYPPSHWQKDFPQIKSHTLRELKKRLLHFRLVEQKLTGPISGFDIEIKLQELARRAGARDRYLLSGIAGGVEFYFRLKQRRVLFKWLNEISESIRWDGIKPWAGIRNV
jgi:hypothetical protein